MTSVDLFGTSMLTFELWGKLSSNIVYFGRLKSIVELRGKTKSNIWFGGYEQMLFCCCIEFKKFFKQSKDKNLSLYFGYSF